MKEHSVLSNARSYNLTPFAVWQVQQQSPHPLAPALCKHCNSYKIIHTKTRREYFFECIDCGSWLGDAPSDIGHVRYHRLYDNKVYQAFSSESVSVFEVLGSTDVNILLSDAAIEICYLFHNEKPPQKLQGKIKELNETLRGKGVAIKFAAYKFLKVFHPQAMSIYFGF